MTAKHKFEEYRFEIRPISSDDGGGYLVTFADLPGCMSDGDTYENAIANAREAFDAWVESRIADGREVPEPDGESKPAKLLLRLPKSIHQRAATSARADGVSLNAQLIVLVSEALAYRAGRDTGMEIGIFGESSSQSHAAMVDFERLHGGAAVHGSIEHSFAVASPQTSWQAHDFDIDSFISGTSATSVLIKDLETPSALIPVRRRALPS